MKTIAIVEAFKELPDGRRAEGKRHEQALCLALFTLAVSAGNRGFLAIGDWLESYKGELIKMFAPPKLKIPSYSTIRRVLLNVDYRAYSACLAKFFEIQPKTGEMIAVDGKVLRGSYQYDNPNSDSHPAIQLVSVYLVERGLILEPYEVDRKSNEIKTLPVVIKQLALNGVCL